MNSAVAKIGDYIRAYDFKPMKGRSDCYIEGTVIRITNKAGYMAFEIEVAVDCWEGASMGHKHTRVGCTALVPFEVAFMEYAGRVMNLS